LSLEQSATSCHVCTVTACFLQSSEDSSLQKQSALTILLCPRSDTRHYGHIITCSAYLLTYLHLIRPIYQTVLHENHLLFFILTALKQTPSLYTGSTFLYSIVLPLS